MIGSKFTQKEMQIGWFRCNKVKQVKPPVDDIGKYCMLTSAYPMVNWVSPNSVCTMCFNNSKDVPFN